MTKIYLIRHAEAEGNIYRRAHGHYNGLITHKGYKQIELLKERFADEQIYAVYSSDLTRASATAYAISQPRNMQITLTQSLREVNLGAWEDCAWGDIEYFEHEMNSYFGHDPAKWHINGSEEYEDVKERMLSCILEAAREHDNETIAVFSHGFAIRALLCRIMGIQSHETDKIPYCDNTAVTLLTYEAGKLSIEYAGDNSHLGKKHSTMEKQSWWRADEWKKPENLRFMPLNQVASQSLVRIFQAKAGERGRVDVQYAAYLADEPVGIAGYDSLQEKNMHNGWISYIHVIPHHREKTFGTQLLGLIVSDFRKLHRKKLRIELPSGSQGINFMGKCGFHVLITTDTICQMEMDIRNK